MDEFQQITMPEVLVFSDFELLKEPENPEVLCELEPEDLQKLIRYLDGSAYDAVVWIAGQALRGMRQLLERSSRGVCAGNRRCIQYLSATGDGTLLPETAGKSVGRKSQKHLFSGL